MAFLIGNDTTTNYTTATNINTTSGTTWEGVLFTSTAAGDTDNLGFWYNSDDTGQATHVKIVLANASGTVLASTAALAVPGASGGKWITGSIASTTIANATNYYIGVYATGGGGRCGWMAHASTSGAVYKDSVSGTYSSLPTTLGTIVAQGINNGLFYAEEAVPNLASNDTPILDGEDDNEFVVAAFTSSINSITITDDKNSNFTTSPGVKTGSGNGTYTYDNQDLAAITVDTVAMCFDSTNYPAATLTVGDGTDTATGVIVNDPASGWAVLDTANLVNTAEGSIFFGSTGIQDTTTGVTIELNPILQGIDGTEWTNGQAVFLAGFSTTPDINGDQTLSISGSVARVSGVTTSAVADGIGTVTSGADGDLGQIYYQTADGAINDEGTYTLTSPSGTMNYRYLDPIDGKAKPDSLTWGTGGGAGSRKINMSLGPTL